MTQRGPCTPWPSFPSAISWPNCSQSPSQGVDIDQASFFLTPATSPVPTGTCVCVLFCVNSLGRVASGRALRGQGEPSELQEHRAGLFPARLPAFSLVTP